MPGCDQIQEAHHLLGMTLLRQDRVDEARSSFESCVRINKLNETGKACDKALKSL